MGWSLVQVLILRSPCCDRGDSVPAPRPGAGSRPAIRALKKRYGVDVGYSGHERGLLPTILAVSMGATVIERHITLDRTMYGSDQSASVEPAGLRQLVGGVRKIAGAMGDGEKTIIDAEKPIAEKLREHLM